MAEAGRDLLVAEICRINIWLRLSTSIGGGPREMRKFILSRCLRCRMDHIWMVVWMPAIISPKIGQTG